MTPPEKPGHAAPQRGTTVTKEAVEHCLRQVIDRDDGRDVVAAGMVSGIVIRSGEAGAQVGFSITIAPGDKERKAYLREACEDRVKRLAGVASVTAVLTGETGTGNREPGIRKPAVWNAAPVEGVKKIIAVASGKGGVGKSTTAVNLALALRKTGRRTGLLDADIYGPSIPRMMGLSGQPEIAGGKMTPLENYGVACMSMGFITGDEAAVLRGPMISKALHQLLRATRWEKDGHPLDLLLADMPPGTGDIALSLAQAAPLDGALIVTTPQEVAVMDARKALMMFRKLHVPVLGVIENMSGGIFGSGGGRTLAAETGAPFLGVIPMDAAIVAATDHGTAYAGNCAAAYDAIIAAILPGL